MKIVIIEDEKPAADRLELLLKRYNPDIQVLHRMDSVKKSVSWFQDHGSDVDLVFMDIRLADGLSFEIFKQVRINNPIIFTTAYNEYALQAFKVNSIDYLLKPISYEDLHRSLDKFSSLRENLLDTRQHAELESLAEMLGQYRKSYKNRFMIRVGDHIRSVPTDRIKLFYADGRVVYLVTDQGREYIVEYRIEELDKVLAPEMYFRLNRTFIVNINAIMDVIVHSNSRLKVVLDQQFEKELIVSREKVNSFKLWFGMRD
jgi:DNA-binding LytR/AlgR family response regulator